MNRRKFVQSAAVFAAATQARPILGANDRVNLAIVGIGGRGRDHINYFSALPDQKIVAIVDVNQTAQERGQALVRKVQGHDPTVYLDLRDALESKEIDAVSIATPNHWHALTTIWSCHAGKDVYVEKPASHDLYEGRQMIAAARKHRRMVQVGSQSRSIAHKRQAMQMLREGVIGEVYMARGMCYRRRRSIGTTPVEPVPAGLDWDLFLGPAPMRPYSENRFAYNWHWFWDTGNGDIGNQGVHELDICRWGLGLPADEEPEKVVSSGGKFVWQDEQETPNTQQALLSYRGSEVQFDVRNLNTGTESQVPLTGSIVGNIFFGSEGFMIVHPTGFQVYMGDEREKTVDEAHVEEKVWDPKPHMQNFLDAVRARDSKVLHADIAEGVASAAMCHYANAAYRTGRTLRPDPLTGRILNDGEANQMLERPGRAPYTIPELV